jgi:hypothetical protein
MDSAFGVILVHLEVGKTTREVIFEKKRGVVPFAFKGGGSGHFGWKEG